MVKVYTYTDLKALRRLSYYEEIKHLPQITATIGRAYGMNWFYRDFPNVIAMSDVLEQLIPFWIDSSKVFQQYLILGRIIHNYQCSEEEINICTAFKKSKRDVLNSIRFLMAAGLSPDDLTPECIEQRILQRIWSEFECETESFCPIRQEMDVLTENPELLIKQLEEKWAFFNSDKVVLHGFFQINPIQQRIIDTIEKAGKEIIYLCCIDPDLYKVNEIWNSTLNAEFGFPPRKEWVIGSDKHGRNHPFGQIFDNGEANTQWH